MTSLEKIVRALETLRTSDGAPSPPADAAASLRNTLVDLKPANLLFRPRDGALSVRDKKLCCTQLAEGVVGVAQRAGGGGGGADLLQRHLPAAVEALLQLADDEDADVRTVADESLSRIQRGLPESNIGRLLVELYRCMKQAESRRTLSAALTRFAHLAHRIRPQKRRAYAVNLLPVLLRLVQRPDPQLQQTLAAAVHQMAPALGAAFTDAEVKSMLQAWLLQLQHSQPMVRRAAAQALVALVSHCRRPELLLPWLLTQVIELLLPVEPAPEPARLLGALLCLRDLVPLLDDLGDAPSAHRLTQLLELLLHYTKHQSHSVATAALDALLQLLRAPPAHLLTALVADGGLLPLLADGGATTAGAGALAAASLSRPDSLASVPAAGPAEADMETESLIWPEPAERPEPLTDDLSAAGEKNDVSLEPSFGPAGQEDSTGLWLDRHESVDSQQDPAEDAPTTEQNAGDSMVVGTPPADGVIDPLRFPAPQLEGPDSSPEETGQGESFTIVAGDVGSLSEGVPLLYCCRLVTSRYLLTGLPGGLRPDSDTRVSIKTLVVHCLSASVALMPELLHNQLYADADPSQPEAVQYLHDALLLAADGDPQLRGAAALLAAACLRGATAAAAVAADQQAAADGGHDVPAAAALQPAALVDLILKVSLDRQHVACCAALEALTQTLPVLVPSALCPLTLPLLAALPALATNSYWLVKVELCAVISALPLLECELVWGGAGADGGPYHTRILEEVLVPLIGDQDRRVQEAAANAIASWVWRAPASGDADGWTAEAAVRQRRALLAPAPGWGAALRLTAGRLAWPPPTPAGPGRADVLSRAVARLAQLLRSTDSKHQLSGCVLALRTLLDQLPAAEHVCAWQLSQRRRGRGLYQLCVSLLTGTQLLLDLAIHADLLRLSCGLATAVCGRGGGPAAADAARQQQQQHWDLLEPLLHHLLRVLNICTLLVTDTPPPPPPTPHKSGGLTSFPSASALSPIKKRSIGIERVRSTPAVSSQASASADQGQQGTGSDTRLDRESTDKSSNKELMGFFIGSAEYQRLYTVMKTVHETYKISVSGEAAGRLHRLLEAAVTGCGALLPLLHSRQLQPLADELLHYCTALVALAPAAALGCVLQLLRAMFAAPSAASAASAASDRAACEPRASEDSSLYQACVNAPYGQLDGLVAGCRRLTAAETEPPPRADYDAARAALLSAGVDKQTLAAYIRLFEPAVIRALKLYTVSSAAAVQLQVLALLIELVQLRVNYCLLDSDQIFIGYVIKQLEHVEEGQLREAGDVIPAIFRFLMVLSYERYHSKTVVSIPKVIQLCDGLMASGQPAEACALPALRPVVEELFVWARPAAGGDAQQELDAQREVVLYMLLRLVQHAEAQRLLALAVTELRRLGGERRWRAASGAVLEALLPPLLALHVRCDSEPALAALQQLLTALCPRALRLADHLLTPLLRQPTGLCCVGDVQRWGGMVTALLQLLVTHVREDVLLSRVEEMGLTTSGSEPASDGADGPQRAVSAQEIVIRLLLSSVELLVGQLASVAASPLMAGTSTLLPQLLARLLQTCIHLLQSGAFSECARCAVWLVQEQLYDLEPACAAFRSLATAHPLLVLSWCNLLTLLGYSRPAWWRALTEPPAAAAADAPDAAAAADCCLALRMLRRGVLVLLCDYVCENTADGELLAWLLTSHITELVSLSGEPPVSDMVAALHRNPSASGLLIQAIATRCRHLNQAQMAQRSLRCLEGAPAGQYGPLLLLLCRRLITSHHLTVADEAERLACRKLEIILAAEERVLSDESFRELLALIQAEPTLHQRPELATLIARLGRQLYHVDEPVLPAVGAVQRAPVSACADRQWLTSMLRDSWGGWSAPGEETAALLSHLSQEEATALLSAEGADLSVLQYCFCADAAAAAAAAPAAQVSHLYSAAETVLLQQTRTLTDKLPSPDQAFASDRYRKHRKRLEERLADPSTWRLLLELSSGVSAYCEDRHNNNRAVTKTAADTLARMALLSLEAARYAVTSRSAQLPRCLRLLLTSAVSALRVSAVLTALGDQQPQWTALAVSAIYRITRELRGPLPDPEVSTTGGAEWRLYQRAASLMLWTESVHHPPAHSTVALIRELTVSLGRLPLLSAFLRVPPDLYHLSWDGRQLEADGDRLSPVPVHQLQEADVLRQYCRRVNTLGWWDRRQFEETWMTYLSVLNAGAEDATADAEEQAVLLQTSCVAVRGITSLLLQALTPQTPGRPGVSRPLHRPRPVPLSPLPPETVAHLRHTTSSLDRGLDASPLLPSVGLSQRLNLERLHRAAAVACHGQLSLRCLQEAARDSRLPAAADSGLDIRSCVVFLLQLYEQWTAPEPAVALPLLVETVRSAVLISDLFTELSQWRWLLALCRTLCQLHSSDDEVLLQHSVLGLCRAAAVLEATDAAAVEVVRRGVEQALRCSLPPARLAAVHGCLLILQLPAASELVAAVAPALSEFAQRSLQLISTLPGYNDDYDVSVWAAAVQLVQAAQAPAQAEFSAVVVQQALRLATHTRSAQLYSTLMQGLVRLVICGAVEPAAGPQELAVEQLGARRGPALLTALTLLTACLAARPAHADAVDQPETLLHVLEAYSHVFNRMRTEPDGVAALLCGAATAGLLQLCPPAEVMSRLIGEFVSPHQTHLRALADTVFEVFAGCVSRHQEALPQQWVLFSLPNFACAPPQPRQTWRLCVFLAAATRRPWLRAARPLMLYAGQLMCDAEQTAGEQPPLMAPLLLTAAVDFYSQLSEAQQCQFRQAIETPAACGDATYQQLLSALTDGADDTATKHAEL